MKRYTVKQGDGYRLTENGLLEEAVQRLAKFENIWERLTEEQGDLSRKMEQLRQEGKTNSVQFRELMVKKLTNVNVLSLFEVYGIREEK